MGLPGISSLGNLFSAVGSTALNLGSSVLGYMSDAKNRASQLDMMREQNAWQSAENDKSRKWQSDEWSRQWNLQNLYNTPSAQVQRLLEAGINPAALLASSGSAPLGVPSASPSTPTGTTVTPQQVTGFSYANSAQFGSTIAQLMEAAARVSDSNLSATQKAKVESEVSKNLAVADEASANAARTNIVSQIEASNLDNEYKAKIANLVALTSKYEADGNFAQASKIVKDLEAELMRIDVKYAPQLKVASLNQIKALSNYYNQKAASEPYVRQNLQASTRYTNALRETENQLRESKVTISEYQAKIAELVELSSESDYRVQLSTENDRINGIVQDMYNKKLINDIAYQNYLHASTENKWQEFQYIMNISNEAFRSITGAVNAKANLMDAMNGEIGNQYRHEFNELYARPRERHEVFTPQGEGFIRHTSEY